MFGVGLPRLPIRANKLRSTRCSHKGTWMEGRIWLNLISNGRPCGKRRLNYPSRGSALRVSTRTREPLASWRWHSRSQSWRAQCMQEASVYGVQLPAVQGGGFRPAGTDLVCFGLDKGGRCWDGKAWHSLYPLGRRQYSSAQGQVDCVVITKITGDCWDGNKWYKLPWGTVSGVVLPAWQGGAFRTTPLPPDAER